MLKYDTTEINPEKLLFVNPYEINPGKTCVQQQQQQQYNQTTHVSTPLTSPTMINIDFGEQQEELFKTVKVEMEEFSDLGVLIPTLQEKFVMDELDLTPDPEGIIDFTTRSYDTPYLGDFIDNQDSRKYENYQLYIDNHHTNIEDIIENELYVLPKELSSGCANSELNDHSNSNSIDSTNIMNKESSIIFNFEENKVKPHISDHQYSSVSSPSDNSVTPQFSPMEYSNSTSGFEEDQKLIKQKVTKFNFGFKLFSENTLNTPDILDSVVSLEDERFNFVNRLNNKNLQTINEEDLKFPLPLSPVEQADEDAEEETANTSQTKKRKKYDDDDEDYVPPIIINRKRKTKKVVVESDSESEDEYIPTKKATKGRSRRVSSVSSDSSKSSLGNNKYRELRDKNNEASRKSRLKRKTKEQEMESESQYLETRNIKLKTEVEELQRMVDNFRSNLFNIMMKK